MAGRGDIAGDATAFDDGAERFHIGFVTADGLPGSVSLPLHCLDHLTTTLPRIAAGALRAARPGTALAIARPATNARPRLVASPTMSARAGVFD